MSTEPAAPPADIDAGTLATIESRAFGLFKQVMEEACKAEQFTTGAAAVWQGPRFE